MDHNIGRKIDGRYEITELIGIGGMADVYKAVDIMENKTVAVKILKTEFARNEDFQRRFRNESKAIAVLSHPNIVKIFDVGFTENLQYIVMEYIDGITLKEFMEQQKVLKWKDAVHFTIQILRALQHAHDRGIVHRDIKPQNIMLFTDGTIKVMDFGIARFSREDGKTLSDKTIGSVHYISPEQARGDLTDEKSDIYSVGVMLYEMLTGKKPFEADTPVAVALMHMQDAVKRPKDINETIPDGLEEVILHAMQKDASKRYQSASEMIKDLEIFKADPTVVFGYTNNAVTSQEATIFFNPVSRTTDSEEDVVDDEEDDDIEEEKASLVVPILTGVAVGVVVIAAIIICILLYKTFNTNDSSEIKVPNLIGMSIQDAKSKYDKDFNFIVKEEYSADAEQGIIFKQDPPADRVTKTGVDLNVTVSKGPQMVEIPDLKNKSEEAARSELENLGFVPTISHEPSDDVPKDLVTRTDPAPYTKVPYGSEVTIYLSVGPTSNDTKVPDMLNMSQADAEKALHDSDLTPDVVFQYSEDKEPGIVISQQYPKNTILKKYTSVKIYISTKDASENEVNLRVPIPAGTTGKFNVVAYLDGKSVGKYTIDNAGATDSFPISVKGKGTNKTIKIFVSCPDNPGAGEKHYADVVVNFVNQKYNNPSIVNPNAFNEVSPVQEPDSSSDTDSDVSETTP